MYRVHYYTYIPILIGGRKRYRIELPLEASPVAYKTLTSNMRVWDGQMVKNEPARSVALIQEMGRLVEVTGVLIKEVSNGHPCIVMEHLNIDGKMEFMIGDTNILCGDQNFVNFGIPNGKHIRIDIYTGECRIIE